MNAEMSQQAFFENALERVRGDYEAPHTIEGDLSRDHKREVTEREVLDALLSLAKNGLVQSYLYDAAAHRYAPVALDAGFGSCGPGTNQSKSSKRN